jgi:hypothetical protein
MHPMPWRAAPAVKEALGTAFDWAFDCWLFLLCVGALSGCACDLHQRHTTAPGDPEPWYIVEICHKDTPQQTTRLVCTSKTRLPKDASTCPP